MEDILNNKSALSGLSDVDLIAELIRRNEVASYTFTRDSFADDSQGWTKHVPLKTMSIDLGLCSGIIGSLSLKVSEWSDIELLSEAIRSKSKRVSS